MFKVALVLPTSILKTLTEGAGDVGEGVGFIEGEKVGLGVGLDVFIVFLIVFW